MGRRGLFQIKRKRLRSSSSSSLQSLEISSSDDRHSALDGILDVLRSWCSDAEHSRLQNDDISLEGTATWTREEERAMIGIELEEDISKIQSVRSSKPTHSSKERDILRSDEGFPFCCAGS